MLTQTWLRVIFHILLPNSAKLATKAEADKVQWQNTSCKPYTKDWSRST